MTDITLYIRDFTEIMQMLQQLVSDKAQKMLGVWLVPDGINARQLQSMRATIVTWSKKIRTGILKRTDVQ